MTLASLFNLSYISEEGFLVSSCFSTEVFSTLRWMNKSIETESNWEGNTSIMPFFPCQGSTTLRTWNPSLSCTCLVHRCVWHTGVFGRSNDLPNLFKSLQQHAACIFKELKNKKHLLTPANLLILTAGVHFEWTNNERDRTTGTSNYSYKTTNSPPNRSCFQPPLLIRQPRLSLLFIFRSL